MRPRIGTDIDCWLLFLRSGSGGECACSDSAMTGTDGLPTAKRASWFFNSSR